MPDPQLRRANFTIPEHQRRDRYYRAVVDLSVDPGYPEVPAEQIEPAPYAGFATRILPNDPERRYPPVGCCIYCGSREYSATRPAPLGGEHVIHEAIGGNLYLGLASCMDCENFTSGTESKVTAGMFAPARERLKIRGKRGRLDRPKFPTSIFVDGKEVSVRLPIDQTHPTMLLLPQLYGPALLVGRNSSLSGFAGVWLHGFFENEDVPHKRFAAPAIDLLSYCQMLAKIAHSFATAAVGLGVFEPLLVEFIRRRHARTAPMDMWAYELIGGVETPFTPSDALHELVLGTAPHLSQTYLCVTIRLFALLAGPIYTVLVGPLRPGVTVDDVGRLAAQRAPL